MPAYVDRVVTGTPADLSALVSSMTAAGELVSMTAPRPTAGGLVCLTVRTTTDTTSTQHAARLPGVGRVWVRPALIAAGVLGAVAAVGLAVWAVYLAVVWLVAWVAAYWPLIVGALVAVVVLLFKAAGGGRHCPGC